MLSFEHFQLGFLNSHFTEMDKVRKEWLYFILVVFDW